MERPSKSNKKVELLSECIVLVANYRDKQAFTTLFDHYAPLIRAYSLAREPGADLVADELAQEVMIRVWLKARSFNPKLANINTWLFTLARNCRIDYLRRNSRYASSVDPTKIFSQILDDSPSPFLQVHQGQLKGQIKNGLAGLPQEQAQILNKVYLEGKTHKQVSTELNLPLGTVKSRVRLALRKMQVLVAR